MCEQNSREIPLKTRGEADRRLVSSKFLLRLISLNLTLLVDKLHFVIVNDLNNRKKKSTN